MVKAVGLDPGEYEVKAVELEGTYRKPRLLKANVDRVSQLTVSAADPQHASAEASALSHAIKDAGLSKQNIALGFPCREAVIRQIVVPFTGTDRIRKVIKFEAEGEIHSQNVDDMIVDFHTIEEVDDETRVMVAGVPKMALRTTLHALERVGIEPERVDLDTMALFRIATWSGALEPDDEVPGNEVAKGAARRSRVVLDFGARSVLVLVVTDGHLVDMRAIPMGCDNIAETIAAAHDVGLEVARDAVAWCLETREDFPIPAVEVPEQEPVSAGEGDDIDAEPGASVIDGVEGDDEFIVAADFIPYAAVDAAKEKFFVRLRREFMRFLVAVKDMGEIEAVFTTGGGSNLPALSDLLAEVFGCESQPLLFMELLQHKLSEDEVAYLEPRIAVALGLALRQLGGGASLNFRQEDLVYTRGFDRIKLPLAIACMLLVFWVCFHGLRLKKQVDSLELQYGLAVARESSTDTTRRGRTGAVSEKSYEFTGYLGNLVNRGFWPSVHLQPGDYGALIGSLVQRDTFERIIAYYNRLKDELRKVQEKGEYHPELELESGVAVLEEMAGIIMSVEKQLGRFYIGDIDLNLDDRARTLILKAFFRGGDFRLKNQTFKTAFEQKFHSDSSAFAEWKRPETEAPVSGTGDEGGAYYTYTLGLGPKVPIH